MFPALAILNRFLLGDTILTEPIASEMAVSQKTYVLCNYPDIFTGHPKVTGIRAIAQMPDNTRIIDLTESIRSIKDGMVVPHKFENMCKEAGFNHTLRGPHIYLQESEWKTVQDVRNWYNGHNVGVILESKHRGKNWLHILPCIKKLVKKRYNVFIIAEQIDDSLKNLLPKGVHFITQLTIRDLILRIAMMDIVIGPDTGPLHIAGALGIPIVVVCFPIFEDLYDIYPHVVQLPSDNFTLKYGIRGISVKKMLNAIDELIGTPKAIPISDSKAIKKSKNNLYIRMRGIGDIYLSLPAIATAMSLNGKNTHTYMTSNVGKKILDCTDIFDNVIGIKYNHATSGYPLPPQDQDYEDYDIVNNMINAIDFIPDSDIVPRTELFAKILGVEKIDYDLPSWKIYAPQEWREEAHELMTQYGIQPGDKTIALQVDTMGRSRGWPKARQIDFCGKAHGQGFKVILLSDKEYSKYPKSAINLTGKTSISEYIGIIATAALCVSPDSAMIHIAGAMDKQCIGLFGAVDPELRIAHYKTIHPIVGSAKCCRQDNKHIFCNDWQKKSCAERSRVPECMWGISSNQVIKKVKEVLEV